MPSAPSAAAPRSSIDPVTFPPERVPFTHPGSLMTINAAHPDQGKLPPGLFFRFVGGSAWPMEVFHLDLRRDGQSVSYTAEATPERLRLHAAGGGMLEARFHGADVLRLRLVGIDLRLALAQHGPYDYVAAMGPGRAMGNCFSVRSQFALSALAGTMQVDAAWHGERSCGATIDLLAGTDGAEIAIEPYRVDWPSTVHRATFADGGAEAARSCAAFTGRLPQVPETFAAARARAGYELWSAQIGPRGHLTRRTLFMSKRWMQRVWSWDLCFNAAALAQVDPDLAWDQLGLLIDHQDPGGAFFDCVDDQLVVWNFTKPPVHGWALQRLIAAGTATPARLAMVYEPLARWTRWWRTQRDADGDGLPEYRHGNDSGWDNSTIYDAGVPVTGPDLSAYLALQMDVLADVADRLGLTAEAEGWRTESKKLIALLVDRLWRGDRFIAPRAHGQPPAEGGDSLITCMPILLGRRLPAAVSGALVAALADDGRFLGPHGLASESRRSPKHQGDGYWRGAVWAPPNVFAVDGLRDLGEHELADRIALRFCTTCARSGFAENFHPDTGAAQRDPAYTWTSSAFLLLGNGLLRR